MRGCSPLSCLLLAAALVGTAVGQTATLTLAAAPSATYGVAVDLRDLRAEGGGGAVVDLRLAFHDAALVALDLRSTESFGALGNVTFELGGAVRTDGLFQGWGGVRGVLGPVALAASLHAFDAPPGAFGPVDTLAPGRPDFDVGEPAFGVAVEAAVRLGGASVLTLGPEAYRVGGETALRLSGDLTLRRLIGDVDGIVLVHAFAGEGLDGGHAALGVGAVWRRRRAPIWSGSLWYGVGRSSAPGVRVALAERFGDTRIALSLAAEPFRRDLPPYRGETTVALATSVGELTLRGAAEWDEALSGLVSVGLTLPIAR